MTGIYDLVVTTLGTTTTPAWLGDVNFNSVQTVAESLAGTVAPVIVTVMGVVIGIKLLKKFGNKIG